jgi:hypothetical protein
MPRSGWTRGQSQPTEGPRCDMISVHPCLTHNPLLIGYIRKEMETHSPQRRSRRAMCPRSAVSGRINASRGRTPTIILEVRLSGHLWRT